MLGKEVTSGFKTYFQYLNEQGGANGHKIKVVTLDDGGKPDRGITNIKQLLLEQPVGVLANVGSAVSIPVQQRLTEAKVPQILYVPIAQLLSDPYNFAVGLSSDDNYYVEAQYLKTLAGAKKPSVSLLIIDTPAQAAARKLIAANVTAAGWTVGTDQKYTNGSTDLSPQVQQLKVAHPDYIMGGFLDDVAPQILSKLSAAGVTAPLVNFSPGSGDTSFSAIASEQFLAVRDFSSPTDPQSKDAATIRKAAAKYGTTGDISGLNFTKGWIMGMLYAGAIKTCGDTCTGEAVRNALEANHNFSIGDLGAPIAFSPESRAGTHSGRIYKWDAAKKAAVPISPIIKAEKLS